MYVPFQKQPENSAVVSAKDLVVLHECVFELPCKQGLVPKMAAATEDHISPLKCYRSANDSIHTTS